MKIFMYPFVIQLAWIFIICCREDTSSIRQDGQSDLATATVTQLTAHTALLRWEKVANQNVSYSVWLNGKEIHSNIKETEVTLKALNPDSTYAGEIRAADGKGVTWKIPVLNFRINYPGQIYWGYNPVGFGEGFGRSVVRASDGGYLVINELALTNDRVILKNCITSFDADGKQQWKISLGGKIRSVTTTCDRGYALAGNTQPPEGHAMNVDVWVLKLDAHGRPQWRTSFGGTDQDYASYIFQASDGGYVIGGSSNPTIGVNESDSDYWIVRLDSLGNLLNEHNLGGAGVAFVRSVGEVSGQKHATEVETWRSGR
ncbi:fibronectin type III domain-containing protein [Fulvivirgaceae bacterium BMA12]|uniref:Fibronectin type III domain-containing protein n=1 Tax=Agaribacillus aureus TaxID=3051825 RepID=A0ABT8LM09_9BACT|nr:fibronectin type III domain-containing protein [Fulvivirgaceae bacterium BMA12]